MRRRSRTRAALPADVDINVINLIDIMFLILTFYIISGKLTPKEYLFNTNLPRDRGQSASKVPLLKITEEMPIRLALAPSGKLVMHLGLSPCASYEALTATLSRFSPPPDCVVESEPGVALQAVISAVEAAKQAGVKKVMMAVPKQ